MNQKHRVFRNITNYNHKRIYEISTRLKYCNDIQELFIKYPRLKAILREIYKYYKRKKPVIYESKNTFTISAVYLADLLKKKDIARTKATANKYLNYLCCLGFFDKVSLDSITDIKPAVLLYDKQDHERFISAFAFRKYKRPLLERINHNARLLIDNQISPGNISYKKLQASICPEINKMAEQIHVDNQDIMAWYDAVLPKIVSFIDKDIEQNGYTTKRRIHDNVRLKQNNNSKTIDNIIKTFRVLNNYIYKRPGKEEREKYNYKGNKHIILPIVSDTAPLQSR